MAHLPQRALKSAQHMTSSIPGTLALRLTPREKHTQAETKRLLFRFIVPYSCTIPAAAALTITVSRLARSHSYVLFIPTYWTPDIVL